MASFTIRAGLYFSIICTFLAVEWEKVPEMSVVFQTALIPRHVVQRSQSPIWRGVVHSLTPVSTHNATIPNLFQHDYEGH